ncbi:hypothetical protein CORC01_01521 [Colletotrichum orchidophilum]|uniref:Uncharacterized protein n=1 Tax=Colletotrichum orchidophilum TaxID=1209926 RepID=A0A1G4BP89_9PEZI|nr:uncharacterized protein CORC01_01521 [Colletotrichum orchidophilum]OHF03137.1 hypothetical protein CORC01_01521 [Colletotrichum orchidophilum]
MVSTEVTAARVSVNEVLAMSDAELAQFMQKSASPVAITTFLLMGGVSYRKTDEAASPSDSRPEIPPIERPESATPPYDPTTGEIDAYNEPTNDGGSSLNEQSCMSIMILAGWAGPEVPEVMLFTISFGEGNEHLLPDRHSFFAYSLQPARRSQLDLLVGLAGFSAFMFNICRHCRSMPDGIALSERSCIRGVAGS